MIAVAAVALNQGFPAVDYFIVGGVRSPGKATLVDAPREYGWQVDKGFGFSGATVRPTGDELSTVKFSIEIWDPADIPQWNDFALRFLSKALVKATGGVEPMALGILHPSLNAPPLNIAKVVVKQVTALLNDGYGLWSSSVTFLEYRPPIKALQRPPAALPPVTDAKPTALDAADRQIQAKTATIQDLAVDVSTLAIGHP